MIIANIIKDYTTRSNKLERLWLLAKIEFKLRYYENKLGLFWALLKPVMDICIYYVAFKLILKSDVPSFASYLFMGLVVWNFFLESTQGTYTHCWERLLSWIITAQGYKINTI